MVAEATVPTVGALEPSAIQRQNLNLLIPHEPSNKMLRGIGGALFVIISRGHTKNLYNVSCIWLLDCDESKSILNFVSNCVKSISCKN